MSNDETIVTGVRHKSEDITLSSRKERHLAPTCTSGNETGVLQNVRQAPRMASYDFLLFKIMLHSNFTFSQRRSHITCIKFVSASYLLASPYFLHVRFKLN